MSFFKKLKSAITKITGRDNSENFSLDLEDTLIEADFGPELANRIAKDIGNKDNVLSELKITLESILNPLIEDFDIDDSKKPYVIVLVGVNGSGKTTTVAKIVSFLKSKGFSVDIAACDTFRAAATEQLTIWAEKLGCNIFKSDVPKDPASVTYEALHSTKSDVLIVDTAGRLHNNTNLMNELSKIYRVINKIDASAPHKNILILDSTTGQNTIEQVREFNKIHPISGIIITKMDGASKGGTIVRIAEEFKLPILGVGIGESEKDLEKFSVEKFLRDLME
jgi:fused signal recognition particle receptor